MGFIYKITSPSLKVYIGQTIKTIEKRWKEHIEDATNINKDHCKALNQAIRKYNIDDFTNEILLECDDELLDEYEIKYINEYNSLTPNGYNIKLGGSSGKHSEETKLKISESSKGRIVTESTKIKMMKSKKTSTLPMYLLEFKRDTKVVGYRICNHPMGPERKFADKTQSLESKLEKALIYLTMLNQLTTPIKVIPRTLPQYLQKNGKGYRVKYPDTKVKHFVSTSITNEENYNKAVLYLESLKEKVQRLNDNG